MTQVREGWAPALRAGRSLAGPVIVGLLALGCADGAAPVGGGGEDVATMVRLGPAPDTPPEEPPPPEDTSPEGASPSAVPTTTAAPEAEAPASTVPSVRSPFTAVRPVGHDLSTYRSPDDPEVWWRLVHPGPYDGDRVLPVLEDHGEWLRVDLPVRPNGTSGWVRRIDVSLSTHDALVRVDLSERRLWAWEDGHLVAEGPIAVGTVDTPTPTGRFSIVHVEQRDDPDTLFGAWVVGTSGFSEVLEVVDGGDPAVAIHGTNDPAVLGEAVSLGCVRVHDEVVARLARLPLGTPVEIVA